MDVFADESLFRAYKKRTRKLELKQSEMEEMTEEQRIAMMADDVQEQINSRGKFSRRRLFVEEKNVDYINERNRKFNEKLERNYGKHAMEIKGNLDRGTAL